MNGDTYCINTKTGRVITNTKTKLYKKLYDGGFIKVLMHDKERTIKPTILDKPIPLLRPAMVDKHATPSTLDTKEELTSKQEATLRDKIMDVTTDLVKVNTHNLKRLTQQETNDMLKKLLFEKLCISQPDMKVNEKAKERKAKVVKLKNKKKDTKKYKIASSSDTDDTDDSD